MIRTPERVFSHVEDSVGAELGGAGTHPIREDDVYENDAHAELPGVDPHRDVNVSNTVTKAE